MRILTSGAAVILTVAVVSLVCSSTLRRRLQQALCFHETHLKFDRVRIWHTCVKCGHEGIGWDVDLNAKFPTQVPAKVITLRKTQRKSVTPSAARRYSTKGVAGPPNRKGSSGVDPVSGTSYRLN